MGDYKENQDLLHGTRGTAGPLSHVRIVLVEPSHPGNIGSAARAMKVMGLSRLCLVRPRRFPDPEAVALASGAEDLLGEALVVDTLPEALQGCVRVYGTTARDRHVAWPQGDARAAAVDAWTLARDTGPVAFLFGRERTGLTNAELDLCQMLVQIPTGPVYASLNLAQAVQVLAYELQMAGRQCGIPAPGLPKAGLATVAERERFYVHLQEVLLGSGFLQPPREIHMMRRLRRLFDRAMPDSGEVEILRGILTEIQRWAGGQHTGQSSVMEDRSGDS